MAYFDQNILDRCLEAGIGTIASKISKVDDPTDTPVSLKVYRDAPNSRRSALARLTNPQFAIVHLHKCIPQPNAYLTPCIYMYSFGMI